jgi:hypothetical protein
VKITRIALISAVIFCSLIVFSSCGKSKKKTVDDNDVYDLDMIDDDIIEDEETVDDGEIIHDDDIPLNDPDLDAADDDFPVDIDNIVEPDDDVTDDLQDPDVVDDSDQQDGSNLPDEDVDEDVDEEISDIDVWEPQVACTGMSKCYDNSAEMTCPATGDFYGQDYQYANLGLCSAKSFTVSGTGPEEIVLDNLTGLVWQRTLPDIYPGCNGGLTQGETCNWQEATNYCEELSYGGFTDWRLPTIEELSTLPDYGKYIPAIDSSVFPDTSSSYFWTSSVYAVLNTYAWLTYFNNGDVDRYLKTKYYYARCVRGESYKNGSVFTKKSLSGADVVIDEKTNIMWADTYSTAKTWQEALKYCEDMDYAGFANWRLPNVNELKTLFDYSLRNPATSFPAMPDQFFWSSTSYLGYSEYGWYVNFTYGEVYYHTKTNYYHARCIR